MYLSLLIYSQVNEHLRFFFQFGAIMNQADKNINVQAFTEMYIFISL